VCLEICKQLRQIPAVLVGDGPLVVLRVELGLGVLFSLLSCSFSLWWVNLIAVFVFENFNLLFFNNRFDSLFLVLGSEGDGLALVLQRDAAGNFAQAFLDLEKFIHAS